jgi:hypothetical protein
MTASRFSFLRRFLPRRDARRRPGSRPPGLVPRVRLLEDRTLPSTFVVMNLLDSGPGSLRDAVQKANAHPGADTIVFQRGLTGTITLTSGELAITDTLVIKAPGATTLAVSGDGMSRVFDVASGTPVAISGLTIENGVAVQGGGIDNFGTLSLTDCTVFNNQAVGGSGTSTTPNAANGGGIANEVGASLTLTDSLLTKNVAAASTGDDSFGGAVLNLGSTTATGCTFANNQVTGGSSTTYYSGSYGGAINSFGFGPSELYNSRLTVSGCTFSGNQAVSAGGSIYFADAAAIDVEFSAVASISNCTFTGNVGLAGTDAYAQAGAIFAEGCTLGLTGDTFNGNEAIGGGNRRQQLAEHRRLRSGWGWRGL